MESILPRRVKRRWREISHHQENQAGLPGEEETDAGQTEATAVATCLRVTGVGKKLVWRVEHTATGPGENALTREPAALGTWRHFVIVVL